MTGFVPVMWSVWGVLVLLMICLKIYAGRLTRDEDDQIILDDSFDNVKAEQAAIMAKVAKLEPVLRTVFWLTAAATLVVIVYYVRDVLITLHLVG
jgi:nucleoside recognition membrane protein YjiH